MQSIRELTDADANQRIGLLHPFKVEEIQYLAINDLQAAQGLVGHGETWGRWETPKSLAPNKMARCLRDIDIERRLRDFVASELVASELVTSEPISGLLAEGVLALTRLGLLMRLVPSGLRGKGKSTRLKPSSISSYLYNILPRITARAIHRKLDSQGSNDTLFEHLTEADIQEFRAIEEMRGQLDRLDAFVALGLWSDAPPLPDIRETTDPSQPASAARSSRESKVFRPFPEAWLAEVGPRVLWVVQELGPNLLRLLEALPTELRTISWDARDRSTIARHAATRIQALLKRDPWRERGGNVLLPPFRLTTSTGKRGADTLEWPPRGWEHVINLSITLQAAHLFVGLLSTAGRIGSLATLARGCVTVGRDGKRYLDGFDYKLTPNLFGDARQWPAPEILVQSLGQQARLATALAVLPKRLQDGLPTTPRFGGELWVSFGLAGRFAEDAEINFNQTLQIFAGRLDVNAEPGGDNFHPHRFRKTIGWLAGVALFKSPQVLKRLFGHKSIEMTLHYILSDPAVREEAERVLRELRIMHCAETLEEIHLAMHGRAPSSGNGGPGAARLAAAVDKHETGLLQAGRIWGEGSAYDLAYLLTAQGQGWRLVTDTIICSKTPGESGLCRRSRSKGEPNTANCQTECDNRIVLARRRRDTELVVERYLDIARNARDDGQLLVLAGVMGNLRDEIRDFADLEEKHLSDPEVRSLLALCESPDTAENVA